MLTGSLAARLRMPIIATLAVAVGFAAPNLTLAQEKLQTNPSGSTVAEKAVDPVLVVTVASLNKLMQDVSYITGAVGQSDAGNMFNLFAGMFGVGLDMSQPVAVIVPLVNGAPQPIALLPTADVKTVLRRLEAQTGGADEQPDGTLIISVGANLIHIKQMGQWAVLAPQREMLDLAPADPSSLFEGMGNDYDLAFRLKLQQVPADTRNMIVNQIRQGFEQAMQKQGGGNADSAREVAESTMKQLEQFINETDELKFGLNIDRKGQQVVIDTDFMAVDGSTLAAMYGGSKAIPSQFASVIRDDAAGYYHASTSISPQAVEQTRTSLKTSLQTLSAALENEESLNDAQRDDIKEMVDRIAELAMDSIEEGRANVGTLLLADQSQFNFLFGAFVADGNEAAQIAKDVAAKVENETDAPRFEFDRSTYKGVTMHLVEADVPEQEDEARKVFGDKLRVHIGTGPKAVYVAVGNESEAMLKSLIDSGASDTVGDRPIGELKLSLLPILEFTQSVESNDTIAAMIDELSRASDKGVFTVVQDGITNGQSTKVTIGEGMVKAIGAAVKATQQAKMQGQF